MDIELSNKRSSAKVAKKLEPIVNILLLKSYLGLWRDAVFPFPIQANAPGTSWRKYEKSSDPIIGFWLELALGPMTFFAALKAKALLGLWLIVGGYPLIISTSAFAPKTLQVWATIEFSLSFSY